MQRAVGKFSIPKQSENGNRRRAAHHSVVMRSKVARRDQVEKLIRGLQDCWQSPLRAVERATLERELSGFDDYPFELVREWLASNPAKAPSNRLNFIETGGVSAASRAEKWKSNPKQRGSKRDIKSAPLPENMENAKW